MVSFIDWEGRRSGFQVTQRLAYMQGLHYKEDEFLNGNLSG